MKWGAAMTVPYAHAVNKLELDIEREEFQKRLFDVREKKRIRDSDKPKK